MLLGVCEGGGADTQIGSPVSTSPPLLQTPPLPADVTSRGFKDLLPVFVPLRFSLFPLWEPDN